MVNYQQSLKLSILICELSIHKLYLCTVFKKAF